MCSTYFEPEGSSSGRLLYIQLWYGTVQYGTVRYGTARQVVHTEFQQEKRTSKQQKTSKLKIKILINKMCISLVYIV